MHRKKMWKNKLSFTAFIGIAIMVFMVWFIPNVALGAPHTTLFDFQNIESQVVSSESPYVYSLDNIGLSFYGQKDIDSAKPDSEKTKISPEGFSIYSQSNLKDDQFQNYIKIPGLPTNSTLNFSFATKVDEELPYFELHKSSPTGEKIDISLSQTTDIDANKIYNASSHTQLQALTDYYLLYVNPDERACSGVNISSLSLNYEVGLVPAVTDSAAPLLLGSTLSSSDTLSDAPQSLTIGNDGYPYCVLWSSTSSNISITFDIESGLQTGIQWQTCASSDSTYTKPNGSWSDISGATTQTYGPFTPVNNNWYRVRVSCSTGYVYSEPVQAVRYAHRTETGTWWYFGNGATATCSNTSYCFDVIGKNGSSGAYQYNSFGSSGTLVRTYPSSCVNANGIPTVLSSEHDMKAIKFSFTKDMPFSVKTTFVLGDSVRALSVDQDTDVAGEDYAMFKVFLNPTTKMLQQLQLVNKRSGQILDNDFAYVMSFADPPNRFWIGSYGSRTSGSNAWNFNIQSPSSSYIVSQALAKETKQFVDNVVVGVNNMDSGFSLCWYNLTPGSEVKSDHGMGKVSDTGALKIEASPRSSTIIDVKNESGKYFALYELDASGAQKSPAIYPYATKSGTTFAFESLKPDTNYRVRCNSTASDSDSIYQDLTTFIDPTLKADHATRVQCTTTGDALVLTDAENTYQYCVKDAAENIISPWASPENGKLTLGGLDETNTYYLYASSKTNSKSDAWEFETMLSIDAVPLSDSELKVTVPDKQAGYEFALTDVEGTKVFYPYEVKPKGEFKYAGLNNDTQYVIKIKNPSTGVDCGSKAIFTMINPLKNPGGGSDIIYTPTETEIKLSNANLSYQFYLRDTVTGEVKGPFQADSSNVVKFTGLVQNRDYMLYAWTEKNHYSLEVKVSTHPSFTVKPLSDHSFQFSLSGGTPSENQVAIFTSESSTTPIEGYGWATLSAAEKTFSDSTAFKPDMPYYIKMKPVSGVGAWEEIKSVRTFINPAKKQEGIGDVSFIQNDIRILVENYDAQYYYGISTTTDGDPSIWYGPDKDGKIEIVGCDPDTQYYVRAKRNDGANNNSVPCPLKTHKAINATAVSSSEIDVTGSNGYQYAIVEDGMTSTWKNCTSDGQTIKFENLKHNDKDYVIYQRSNDRSGITEEKYFETKTVKTWIDPCRKANGDDSKIYSYIALDGKYIYIENADLDYQYTVTTTASTTPSTWYTPDSTGLVKITSTNSGTAFACGTNYYIQARYNPSKTTLKNNSDKYQYAFHNDYTLTAISATAIDVQGTTGYKYAIGRPGQSYEIGWSGTDSGGVTHFSGLKYCDTEYVVYQMRESDPTDIDFYDQKKCKIGLDVSRHAGTASDDSTASKWVKFTNNINSITLSDCDSNYYYRYVGNGTTGSFVKPDASGNITFSNLAADKTYTLEASRTTTACICDKKEITTFKDYTPVAVSSSKIEFDGHKDFKYTLIDKTGATVTTQTATVEGQKVSFADLALADSKYKVQSASVSSGIQNTPDVRETTTWINPLKNADQSAIKLFQNIDSVTLDGCPKSSTQTYEYGLVYNEGDTVYKWFKADSSGILKLDKIYTTATASGNPLEPGTTYYLKARRVDLTNENTDVVAVNTHKDYSVEATASDKIVVTGEVGYEYAVGLSNSLVTDWKMVDTSTKKCTFAGLAKSDTQYTVYARSKTDVPVVTDMKYWDAKTCTTWIDVMRKQGVDKGITTISIYEGINSINLENLDNNYYYYIDPDPQSVGFRKPSSGKLQFIGLDPDTTYTLKASHTAAVENCDTQDVTTFKDFAPVATSSSQIEFDGLKDFVYEIYLTGTTDIIARTVTSADGKVTFSDLPKSDKEYTVRAVYKDYESAKYYDYRTATTWIDPARKSDGVTAIKMYQNINKLTLKSVDGAYTYVLHDGSTEVASKKVATGSDVVFGGSGDDPLIQNHTYTLTAYKEGNIKSDTITLKTHPYYGVEPNLNTVIDISNADTNFDYALFLGTTVVCNWKTATSDSFTYSTDDSGNKLKSDTIYTVKMKEKDSTDFIADEVEVRTYIDPLLKVGSSAAVTPYQQFYRLIFEETDSNYKYGVSLNEVDTPTLWYSPNSSGVVSIDKLDSSTDIQPNTTYYLSAQRVDGNNDNSDRAEFTTHPDYSIVPDSSSQITVNGNPGYEYIIYERGAAKGSWVAADDSGKVVFSNLKYSDDPYTVYGRVKSASPVTNINYWDKKDGITWIDVKRQKGADIDSGPFIQCYENINYLTFENLESTYFYKLVPAGTTSDYVAPVDKKIVFDGLQPDTEYTLYASHTKSDENCDTATFRTFKDFTPVCSDSKTMSFPAWKGFTYQLYLDPATVLDTKTVANDGETITFNLERSDTIYYVRSYYTDYAAKKYYDIRYDRSYIDPERKGDGTTPVKVYKNMHELTLAGADTGYMYALADADGGTIVKDYASPDGDGKLVFDGLTEDTHYWLLAKNNDFTNSEYHEFVTHKEYSIENYSPYDTSLKVNVNPGYMYALFETVDGASEKLIKDYESFGDEASTTYLNLKNDCQYIVKQIDAADIADNIPDTHSLYTYINPLKTRWDGDNPPKDVEHVAKETGDEGSETYSIEFKNVDKDYQYALFSEDGSTQISEWCSDPAGEGFEITDAVSGQSIEPDTTYTIAVKRDGANENYSDVYLTTIGKDLEFVPTSSKTFTSGGDSGYWYQLVDENGNPVPGYEWWQNTDSSESYDFENLVADSSYTLMVKKTVIDTPNLATEFTWVDPWLNEDHTTRVEVVSMSDYITIRNILDDSNYEYMLMNKEMTEVIHDYTAPSIFEAGEPRVKFDDLEANMAYVILARNTANGNENSDPVEIVTHKIFNLKVEGTNGHESFDKHYVDDVTSYDDNEEDFLEKNIYKESETVFDTNEFENLYENDFYSIGNNFKANALSGYDFTKWTLKRDDNPEEGIEDDKPYTVQENEVITSYYDHQLSKTNVEYGPIGFDSFEYSYMQKETKYHADPIVLTDVAHEKYERTDTWVNTEYSFSGDTYKATYSDTSYNGDKNETTVKAVPASGYLFDYWTVTDDSGEHKIDADFKGKLEDTDHEIIVTAYFKHDIVDCTFTADNGHEYFDWSKDINGDTDSGQTKEFAESNTWVNAVYDFNDTNMTLTYTDVYGQEQTYNISAVATDGYLFDHWVLNGSDVEFGSTFNVESGVPVSVTAIYRHDAVQVDINGKNGHENLDWAYTFNQTFPPETVKEKGQEKTLSYVNTWTNTIITFDGDKIAVGYSDDFGYDVIDTKVTAVPYTGYVFDHWIMNGDTVQDSKDYSIEHDTDVEITAYYRHELSAINLSGNNGHDSIQYDYALNYRGPAEDQQAKKKEQKDDDDKLVAADDDKDKGADIPENYKHSQTGIVDDSKSGNDPSFGYDNVWKNTKITFDGSKITASYDDVYVSDYFNANFAAMEHSGYLFDYWTLNGAQVESGAIKTIGANEKWDLEAHYKHDQAGSEIVGYLGHKMFNITSSGQTEHASTTADKIGVSDIWVNTEYKFDGDTLVANYNDSFNNDSNEYKVQAQPRNGWEFDYWTVNENPAKETGNVLEAGQNVKVVANYKYLYRPAQLPMPCDLEEEPDEFPWWILIVAGVVVAGLTAYIVYKRRQQQKRDVH